MHGGFPTAFCAPCDTTQLVWRPGAEGEAACLVCDAPIAQAKVAYGRPDDIADREQYVFLDVTATAEPCDCGTACGKEGSAEDCQACPAQGRCDHTRPDA